MDSPLKHHFESAERPDCLDVSPERLNPMTAAQLERELEAALEAMTEEEYDPAVIDAPWTERPPRRTTRTPGPPILGSRPGYSGPPDRSPAGAPPGGAWSACAPCSGSPRRRPC